VIQLLQAILCVLQNILLAILYAGAFLINLLVAAIAAFVGVLLALLPSMPELPEPADVQALNWMAWFYPVAEVVTALVGMGLLLLTYMVARVALRWMRAEA
jgi:hypothetical protein